MMVIGLTANADSPLAEKSSILLLTPIGGEAPLRSAATVSLTAQLYVVDVLFLLLPLKTMMKRWRKYNNRKRQLKL